MCARHRILCGVGKVLTENVNNSDSFNCIVADIMNVINSHNRNGCEEIRAMNEEMKEKFQEVKIKRSMITKARERAPTSMYIIQAHSAHATIIHSYDSCLTKHKQQSLQHIFWFKLVKIDLIATKDNAFKCARNNSSRAVYGNF